MITSINPIYGGVAEAVVSSSSGLQELGAIVDIVSLDAPHDAWVRNCPISVFALGPGQTSYRYSPKLLPWLRRHVREYDCAIIEGLWQFGSYGVWRAFRGVRPYVVFPHGMLDPQLHRFSRLKYLKKRIAWDLFEHKVLGDARFVVFTAERERLAARSWFVPQVANERVVGLRVAEPPSNDHAQVDAFFEQFPRLLGKELLVFLGRIHPKKGIDLLIKALHQVKSESPSLHLVIAGPDSVGLRSELERLANRLQIQDRITWTGMLSGELKWGALRAGGLFVLPSHQENFGVAIVEALACGTPVLISNKVDICDEIERDGAGFVCPDSVEGTTEAIRAWLSAGPDDRAAMRAKARTAYASIFEPRTAMRDFFALIEESVAHSE